MSSFVVGPPPMPGRLDVHGQPLPPSENAAFARDCPGFDPTPVSARQHQAPANAGVEAQRTYMLMMQTHRQMELMRPICANVININPFPLTVNGVLHDDLVVPACPPGKPYLRYRVGSYKTFIRDMGDGMYVPGAEPPLQLAYDFEREFFRMGGVFHYPGDFDPDEDHLDVHFTAYDGRETTVGEEFQACRERQLIWCRKLFSEAESEYNKPNGNRMIIREWHKRAAHVLYTQEHISELPQWVTLTKAEANKVNCPMCRKEHRAGTVFCPECKYVFDVVKFWDAGMMDPENTQLKRMEVPDMFARGLNPADYLPMYRGKTIEESIALYERINGPLSKASVTPVKAQTLITPDSVLDEEKTAIEDLANLPEMPLPVSATKPVEEPKKVGEVLTEGVDEVVASAKGEPVPEPEKATKKKGPNGKRVR